MNLDVFLATCKAAWRQSSRPSRDEILFPSVEVEVEILERFAERGQFDHSAKELFSMSDAMSFITDKAWHYWLPAYLLAILQYPEDADVLPERVADSLYRWNARDRLKLLSLDQLEVLKNYFTIRIESRFATIGEDEAMVAVTRESHKRDTKDTAY